MQEKRKRNLTRSLSVIIFALLLCLSAFIPKNIFSAPATFSLGLQNMIAILAGTILGGLQGAGAVGLFVIAGVLGLPVFPSNLSGLEAFSSPEGGYIWGYFISSLLGGMILGSPHLFEKGFSLKQWIKIAITSLLCFAVIYIPGILCFRHSVMENTFPEKTEALYKTYSLLEKGQTGKWLLNQTLFPFISSDVIKWIISIPITAIFRPLAARLLYPSDEKEEEAIFENLKKKKEFFDKLTKSKKKGGK